VKIEAQVLDTVKQKRRNIIMGDLGGQEGVLGVISVLCL